MITYVLLAFVRLATFPHNSSEQINKQYIRCDLTFFRNRIAFPSLPHSVLWKELLGNVYFAVVLRWGMLQVFRRLLFCGVWRNGEHQHNSEHKPLYQVEYRDIEDIDDLLHQETEELNLGNVKLNFALLFSVPLQQWVFSKHVFCFCSATLFFPNLVNGELNKASLMLFIRLEIWVSVLVLHGWWN